MRRVSGDDRLGAMRATFSEFCAAPLVKFIEPASTTLRSIVIGLLWVSRTPRSGDQLDIDDSMLGADEGFDDPGA